MVYCDFSNSLYKYLDIYHNGLKKLANKEMQAIVGHLSVVRQIRCTSSMQIRCT